MKIEARLSRFMKHLPETSRGKNRFLQVFSFNLRHKFFAACFLIPPSRVAARPVRMRARTASKGPGGGRNVPAKMLGRKLGQFGDSNEGLQKFFNIPNGSPLFAGHERNGEAGGGSAKRD